MQVGINESLTVNLEMICDCQCEYSGDTFELNSPKCNYKGDLKCGICTCEDGYFGKNCECSIQNGGHSQTTVLNENACRKDNTSLLECEGRGQCECNTCNCLSRENPDEVNLYLVFHFIET